MRLDPAAVRRRLACVGAAVLMMGYASQAGAQLRYENPTFDEMVQRSSSIVEAEIEETKSELRNGNIVSRTVVKPVEYWKGSVSLSTRGGFMLEQPGGELAGAFGIAQDVPATVRFKKGQRVVLFVSEVRPAPQISVDGGETMSEPLIKAGTPTIFGGNQGVFTIMRDPETGGDVLIHGSHFREPTSKQLKQIRKLNKENAARLAARTGMSAPPDQSRIEQAVEPFSALEDLKDRVRTRVIQLEREAAEQP